MEDAPRRWSHLRCSIVASAKGLLGDIKGAISDYTDLIAIDGAPKEFVAKALVSRGTAKAQLGDIKEQFPTACA